MRPLLYTILLSTLLLGCDNRTGNEASTAAPAPTTTTTPAQTAEQRRAQIAAPPKTCAFLTKAEVQALFPEDVRIPQDGQRSTVAYASCQYDLEAPGWNGTLVLDRPNDDNARRLVRADVTNGDKGEKVEIRGRAGRILNDGRVLALDGEDPFRVMFSALAKPGFPEAYDAAARRELIRKLAEAVIE